MKNKYLRDGIQQFLQECGESACYALSLISVAQEYLESIKSSVCLDIVKSLYDACDVGYIYFNPNNFEDNDNLFVKNPELFLKQMTNKIWTITKNEDINYQKKDNEYLVQRYERIKTGSIIAHFQRDTIFYPIKDSLTVKYGKLVSLRICSVL
jgi:hypothetical protein